MNFHMKYSKTELLEAAYGNNGCKFICNSLTEPIYYM